MEDSFIPSKAYNNLPYILDIAEVPKKNRKDIDDLLSLLHKYRIPQGIRVKLVHKRFDTESDEIDPVDTPIPIISTPIRDIPISLFAFSSPVKSTKTRGPVRVKFDPIIE
ncbi:hypothetical protein NA56DRAFT_666180 [Hyaloscypha hepaticicola]|uniref:Uncharacterized protein n=1 Tax=Hyaloscypha hepaticicola TaxID=2082293 RepID=A0A2J6PFD2_9HELO|nr:hypothetical protein NA56DRAFT_666180 [Hyaloscypha hepaticicola]